MKIILDYLGEALKIHFIRWIWSQQKLYKMLEEKNKHTKDYLIYFKTIIKMLCKILSIGVSS